MKIYKIEIKEKNEEISTTFHKSLNGAKKKFCEFCGSDVKFQICDSYDIEMYDARFEENDELFANFDKIVYNALITEVTVGE